MMMNSTIKAPMPPTVLITVESICPPLESGTRWIAASLSKPLFRRNSNYAAGVPKSAGRATKFAAFRMKSKTVLPALANLRRVSQPFAAVLFC
jgi:hypothetical protein